MKGSDNGNSLKSRRAFNAAAAAKKWLRSPRKSSGGPAVLITGGAGFIGTNLAHRLLSENQPVILYDNLSRAGVEQNLEWLRSQHGGRVQFEHGDVRDAAKLRKMCRKAGHVFHLAAQVAVTTSLVQPLEDFEINARGTLNLLECVRSAPNPPSLVFASTNKIYGDLSEVALRARDSRYEPEQADLREFGFDENRPIHFHSPYGCSKGAAEQYVLDYARTFGLRTAVFRMSCIYGPHQFGTEDQGWVAHFLIRSILGKPVTIYGDGRQVRDILFVDDLVEAFLLARREIESLSGQVFNMGGGPPNTTSLLELMDLIGELRGKSPEVRFDAWRLADQPYYVSDTRKFAAATGWRPKVSLRDGVRRLHHWLEEFQLAQSPSSSNGNFSGRRARRPSLSATALLRAKNSRNEAPARPEHRQEENVKENAAV